MNIRVDQETRSKDFENLRFYIHTFGCQMNVNDSEHIAGILIRLGGKKSNSPEESNLIIINTCAVREKSEEKLYSLLGRLKPLKKKNDAAIGVAGCVAQLHRSQLLERKPFIDFIIGPDNYKQIPKILSTLHGEKIISTHWSRQWHEIPASHTFRESPVSGYVTVMEGCNNFCSYCIVPFTRGREKFRPMRNILKEVEDLADKGYQKIQLLGQNVNSYKDPQGRGFSDLLKEVSRVDGIEWIRFITSHPKNFTKDIAITMKETRKVCHQLHLPIQSGSSTVLKRMNRDYTREEYLEKIAMLRDLMPDISLSTDIIVGYPGENEKEFKDTLSILEQVQYTNIFSFRYSPRPLTAASRSKDSVPFETKRRRLIEVQSLQKKIQLEKNKSFVGQVMKVLCTGKSKKDPQVYSGRNEGFQVINFKSNKDVQGQFVDVRITACGPHSLQGTVI